MSKIIIIGKHKNNEILLTQIKQMDTDVSVTIQPEVEHFDPFVFYLIEAKTNKEDVSSNDNILFFTWNTDFLNVHTKDIIFSLPTYLEDFLIKIQEKISFLMNPEDEGDVSNDVFSSEQLMEDENLQPMDSDLFTMTNIGIKEDLPSLPVQDDIKQERLSKPQYEENLINSQNDKNDLINPSDNDLFLGSSVLESSVELSNKSDLSVLESTAPGILKRNNKTYQNNVSSELSDSNEDISLENKKDIKEVEQVHKESNIITLNEHINHGFTGLMEYKYEGKKLKLWWFNGQLGRIIGYGQVLANLLYRYGISTHLSSDIARSLGDPIEFAIKRKLILPSEKDKYFDLVRQEVILDMISNRFCIISDSNSSLSMESNVKYLNITGLILRGAIERLSSAFSWARGGGEKLELISENKWFEIIKIPEIDPLWIRSIELFINGMDWTEACMKSGIGITEGENLAFGLRLIGVAKPEIPQHQPYEDIQRIKVLNLLDRVRTWSPVQILGGKGAIARRNYTELSIFLEKLPFALQKYMNDELKNLKKLLEQAFIETQK